MTGMIIRNIMLSDLDVLVRIHQTAFRGFFLTRMGPAFLQSYYRTVLEYESSIALIAYDSESSKPLGFVVGFRDPRGFYALFGRKKRRLLPGILLGVLRDPGVLPAILLNMRRVESHDLHPVDAVELSSIAVGEAGRGVGSALLGAFVAEARLCGAARLVLTTDEAGNETVRAFYEARGFLLDGIEARGARRMCRYFRSLG